ncbi:hypothetical protein BDQ12DRAFT_685739 [Crucibulum laeve]|uniref:Tetraspanin family-domain-containing protein n=1 Tax=Crucibulum laeve TaxID=68775 RepID=A0A5C3LVB6_9AGAR|nr:hypothetical protein BDQ12DRAFT_685739 [Crucibulum laeve]
MPYVRTRTFCCCLPVRFGVFLLSILAIIGGGFISVISWVAISKIKNLDYSVATSDLVALWIHSIIYTILVIVSIFGLIGAIIKNRNMVSNFATVLGIHLFVSVVSGIYSMVALFRLKPQDAVNQCMGDANDTSISELCKNGAAIMKGITVTIYVLTWLVQLYAYFIVDWYAEQLEEEMSLKQTEAVINTISPPAPVAVTTYNSYGVGGTQPRNATTGYTFTEPQQSYGVLRRNDQPGNMA